MHDNTVGVRDLREHLSRYLDKARHGERVVVTERNRPIAIIAPLPENEDPLAHLIAEGKVIAAEGDLEEYLRDHPPVALDDPYSGTKALEETRAERDL